MIKMTLKKVSLVYYFIIFLGCTDREQPKPNHPNIIYILADDLGYGDLKYYNNNTKIKTPHLDQLARQGMAFMDMHSTSSVCTPTRYSILTGEYAWRTQLKKGVLWSYGPLMIPDQKETVAKLLQRNNYQTAVVGKWHLGLDWKLKPNYREDQVIRRTPGIVTDYQEEIVDFSKNPTKGPIDVGFDYSYILPASLDIPPYVYLENEKFTQPISDFSDGSNLDGDKDYDFWRPGPMAEGFDFYEVLPTFIQKAKAYINRATQKEAPFFLYLPLAAPHTPWVPKEKHRNKSAAGMYGEFVQMVDDQLGKLLEHIDAKGITDQTLVFFTSDNGPYWKPQHIDEFGHRAAANLRGMKGDIYEAGHRVPFIVKWPGKVAPSSKSNQINSLANFYATVSDLLGIPSNAPDSFSLFDELTGATNDTLIRPIVHHSSQGHFAIRYGDWKMIEKRGSGGFTPPAFISPPPGVSEMRIFNIKNDPSEKNDLAKEYPNQLEIMKFMLDSIRQPN
jgi:arylsulfatase A-like enzyme